MTDQERIAALEAIVVELWHESIEPYLLDPKYGNRFLKVDRKVRELGLVEKLKR